MAVTSQPGSYAPSEFQTGLCSICDDCGICCYTMCCFPCVGCSIASDMGECCLCGTTLAMRSVYRTKYNIKGSMCKDWFIHNNFLLCSVCQLKRDIELRKKQGIF